MTEPKAEAKTILEAKDKIEEAVPSAPDFSPVSSAQALKERLDWGKPALTIIDARDREAFLEERIMGAMLMSDVSKLADSRDIYIYSDNDQNTATAAENMRQAGFANVSQLQGGLAGWKAINGPTEGRAA